jgi:hypothetical protein
MAHEKVFKTVEEAQAFIQPWIDKISADLGCSIEPYSYNDGSYRSGGQNTGDWFYGAYLKYLGYDLGRVMMQYQYNYDRDTHESWQDAPYVQLSLNTRVTFEMKSIFTKTNMRHDVKIKLNVSREMSTSDKDYKKFIDWAKLIMKQLKTAEAKKRKFQADVDFE